MLSVVVNGCVMRASFSCVLGWAAASDSQLAWTTMSHGRSHAVLTALVELPGNSVQHVMQRCCLEPVRQYRSASRRFQHVWETMARTLRHLVRHRTSSYRAHVQQQGCGVSCRNVWLSVQRMQHHACYTHAALRMLLLLMLMPYSLGLINDGIHIVAHAGRRLHASLCFGAYAWVHMRCTHHMWGSYTRCSDASAAADHTTFESFFSDHTPHSVNPLLRCCWTPRSATPLSTSWTHTQLCTRS